MYRITILLFLVFSLSVNSQNQKLIDSLNKELKTEKTDTIKAKIILKIWDELVDTDASQSLEYANMLIDIGTKSKNNNILAEGYMKKGVSISYLGDIKESTNYTIKALTYYKKQNNYSKIGYAQMCIGIDKTDISEYKTAKKYLDSAIINYNKHEDTYGLALVHTNMRRLWFLQGYYKLANKSNLKALELAESINNEFLINSGNTFLASYYSIIKDTINAEKKYLKAIKKYKDLGSKRSQYQSTVILASIYNDNEYNFKKAEALLNDAIPELELMNDQYMLIIAYKIKGTINYQQKKYDQALKYLQKSLQIAEAFNNPNNISEILLRIGETHFELANYREALNYAEKYSRKYNDAHGSVIQSVYYRLTAKIYKATGNYKEALKYQELITKTDEKVNSDTKSKEIEELNIIYETSKKEAELTLQQEEIKNLNIQANNDKLTKTLYGTGMISFIAIAGLLFFGFKQRIKKNKIEREKQEEIYKQEIEFKKKELTSQTLHLVQKNTFIQELKENLEKIKQSPELFKVEFRRLVMLLKKESAEDKDWEVFKSYFTEVHNNFDIKIKEIYADISEKEIRLASFLRMNLSTKEIASMLNVLPESVLKSKYRLKKKLNLNKETDLNQFLNTL
jgi:tetratricopeptide (TPR) repeat protein